MSALHTLDPFVFWKIHYWVDISAQLRHFGVSPTMFQGLRLRRDTMFGAWLHLQMVLPNSFAYSGIC